MSSETSIESDRRDIIRQVCEILLPKPVDDVIEDLFSEHFQSFFSQYIENGIDINSQEENTDSSVPQTDDDIWIFGYGSLLWKPGFPYIDRKQGYIEGYDRRFFQYSIDHRGTAEKPGRVVTLVRPQNPQENKVYGVAYRIASSKKDEVISNMDFRERNGYERSTLEFYDIESGQKIRVIVYIATEGNESFAASTDNDLERIAEQIYLAAGTSGTNREYLYKLANAMRELFPGVDDDHLFRLDRMVKMREKRDTEIINGVKVKIKKILDEGDVDAVIAKFNQLKKEVAQNMVNPSEVWTLQK